MRQTMEIYPTMISPVHISEEHYSEISKEIRKTVPNGGYFFLTYPIEDYLIDLRGDLEIEVIDAKGDGYFTPYEIHSIDTISLISYEITDEYGDPVETDFNPEKIH